MRRSIPLLGAFAIVAGACSTPPPSTEPPSPTPTTTTVAGPVGGRIVTVVGTGGSGTDGHGGPATQAELLTACDVAFDPAGNLFVAERLGERIMKVDTAGIFTVVAGTGETGFAGDGGPAIEALFNGATAIAAGPDGNLYIADLYNSRIRMVDAQGIITTVAGTGETAFSGDGGPATEAALNGPVGLAFDPAGNLYFLDTLNYRIRRIDTDGIITTVAGTGTGGFSPDGTPAADLMLYGPSDHCPGGIAFDPEGRLHFADLGNGVIRMIDHDGTVRTVAGNGDDGTSGDGGPAVEAGVGGALDIQFGPDGALYISTHDHAEGPNHRIRVVVDGRIFTIAGTGARGYAGDDGPAAEAMLNIPAGLAIGPDGNLNIADGENFVVRMVEL